ncbi:MAG: DUF262 domain-containing HNH endonuclease family protein [Planctomycetes bacterium]|nr:DUF262 domain-containing HNH endonuclease family protein [Planctomycetota bacterium]
MSASNFNTRNDTFRKLMGNGLSYRVPRFQRDYSWDRDEWDDLWLDLLGTIAEDGEPAHYMGYLVLQSDNEKSFDVIDGQQRLTTLSILVLAVMKNLQRMVDAGIDAERTKQRIDQLRSSYIGYLDPVSLVAVPKLALNRNNNLYYQNYLVPLANLPQRGFKASEHLLRKAFEYFDKKVSDYAKKQSDVGMSLAKFVDTLSDRLFFTVINVTDELNAYKVFETLNSRGVRLSPTDLLKNYLFSVLDRNNPHEHEMKNLEDRWESMVGRLGDGDFPHFLRVHWNSRNSSIRETNLFKVIRKKVNSRELVFELLRGMEEDVETYIALRNPESSTWAPSIKHFASTLKLFGVKQPYSLLCAAKRRFSDADFESLFRASVMASFRYNVICNLPTNEQESVYGRIANKISSENIYASETIKLLKDVYPTDETFKLAFSEKVIKTTTQKRNKQVVKYILCAIERTLSNVELDFDSDALTIEHVLPQNPTEGWNTFAEDEIESMVYRLGNMTLLQAGPNRDIGNKSWNDKREVFRASAINITKRLAEENSDWNPARLCARQNWMANQAASIWRIAQLS